MTQLSTLEANNKEIIEDTMIIDEANILQEDLISNDARNETPSTRTECEGTSAHEASLLKHAMSGTTVCPKSFDRMKNTTGFRAASLTRYRLY